MRRLASGGVCGALVLACMLALFVSEVGVAAEVGAGRMPIQTLLAGLEAAMNLSSSTMAGATLSRAFTDGSDAGFHRTLVTQIVVDRSRLGADESHCSLLLRETLPQTFYYDLYQFDRLAQRHASSARDGTALVRAYCDRDVELERSAESSDEYTVWMHVPQPQWRQHDATDKQAGSAPSHEVVATIHVPIHARYQSARFGATHADASIGPPEVFLRCSKAAPSLDHPLPTDGWSRVTFAEAIRAAALVTMAVPVGDLADLAVVRLGTAIITIGAALALCTIAWRITTKREHRNDAHTD